MKSRITRGRIFSVIVVAYMLFALMWWAILLIRKTNNIYRLKSQLSEIYPEAALEQSRQTIMIYSEAFFFGISLIIGIYFVSRTFRKEIALARQQKNFLLSVTHELKSPITAIKLIFETFKRRKLSSEQSDKLIHNGNQEAQRLENLVEDLLLSARINPKERLAREDFDFSIFMQNLIRQYREKYLDFTFDYTDNTQAPVINTSLSTLKLIIYNIVDNAIKYSNDSKKVKITADLVKQKIRLRIKDRGVGIPDEEKKMIFQQFYRVGDEHTRSTTGTGLGLYLVKELSKKLDIKVSVANNTPKGSIFEILIPIKNT